MVKPPAFAKAFAGRWRIVETDVWDNDVLDEVEEAHITFGPGSDGEIVLIAISGSMESAKAMKRSASGPLSRIGL